MVKLMRAGVAIAATVGGLSSTADAAQFGFYVGGQYGEASTDANQASFDAYRMQVYQALGLTPITTTTSFDSKDSTYGVLGGYRFSPYLAVEGAYLNLGRTVYRAEGSVSFAAANATVLDLNTTLAIKTQGVSLAVLGILPLTYNFEMYARGGVLFGNSEFEVGLRTSTGALVDRISDSSSLYVLGVGASVTFIEVYTARLEYQRIAGAGYSTVGEHDVDTITIGITARF